MNVRKHPLSAFTERLLVKVLVCALVVPAPASLATTPTPGTATPVAPPGTGAPPPTAGLAPISRENFEHRFGESGSQDLCSSLFPPSSLGLALDKAIEEARDKQKLRLGLQKRALKGIRPLHEPQSQGSGNPLDQERANQLRTAVQAQDTFLENEIGKELFDFCSGRHAQDRGIRNLTASLTAKETAINQAERDRQPIPGGTEACNFSDLQSLLRTVRASTENVNKTGREIANRLRVGFKDRSLAGRLSIDRYGRWIEVARRNPQSNINLSDAEAQNHLRALADEWGKIWQPGLTEQGLRQLGIDASFQFSGEGFFSFQLREFQKMLADLSRVNQEFIGNKENAIAEAQKNCRSLNRAPTGAERPEERREAPPATRTERQPAGPETRLEDSCYERVDNQTATQPGAGNIVVRNGETGFDRVQGVFVNRFQPQRTPIGGSVCPDGTRRWTDFTVAEQERIRQQNRIQENPDSPDDTNRDPIPPPLTPPPAQEESWLSRNRNTLLVGGAGIAAVAGALWYKKEQDKKARDRDARLEAEAAAMVNAQKKSSSDASSSSGSSSTNGADDRLPASEDAPQGSKLVIKGEFSDVAVDDILPTIEIAILAPNGKFTQSSNINVTVSCNKSCNLKGTRTVRTQGGKAFFGDLQIGSEVSDVELTFSAPGFSDVKAPNTFTVRK